MRQPENDFRYDPFKTIRPESVGSADVNGALANHFAQYKNNTYNSLMLKFCSGKCYNLSGSAVDNSE